MYPLIRFTHNNHEYGLNRKGANIMLIDLSSMDTVGYFKDYMDISTLIDYLDTMYEREGRDL